MVAIIRKKRRLMNRRKRSLDPTTMIDYKRPDILKRFVTDRGKIIPRRISGATAAQQRAICVAVKRARFLAIIPSSNAHRNERGFSGLVSMSYAIFDRNHKPYSRDSRGPRDEGRDGGYEGGRDRDDGDSDNRSFGGDGEE